MNNQVTTIAEDKTISIFIMEEDEFFRIFLQDTLIIHSSQKVLVSTAPTAKDGLQILYEALPFVPDAIILCLSIPMKYGEMPDMLGGFKVLKELRANENFKKVPIIIFSKYSDAKIRKKAKELGATKYLVKGDWMPRDIANVISKAGEKYSFKF